MIRVSSSLRHIEIFVNSYFCLARKALSKTDHSLFNTKVQGTSLNGNGDTLPCPHFAPPSEQLARQMGMEAWYEE